MAAKDTYLDRYYQGRQTFPNQVVRVAFKEDISDSVGGDNHLAESGDKVFWATLPQYAVPLWTWFSTKGLDTNATATTAVQLVIAATPDTSPVIWEPPTVVTDLGAWSRVAVGTEAHGDILDGSATGYDVYLEATAAAATAGTSGCEAAAAIWYLMERDSYLDPA